MQSQIRRQSLKLELEYDIIVHYTMQILQLARTLGGLLQVLASHINAASQIAYPVCTTKVQQIVNDYTNRLKCIHVLNEAVVTMQLPAADGSSE